MMTVKATIENIVTLIITAVIVLGLYALGAGAAAFFGFVCLFNLNYVKRRCTGTDIPAAQNEDTA